MKAWETRYKGHTIRVENSFAERLFVDEELQDEHGTVALRSRLHGKIRDGDGAGDAILVSLGGGFFRVRCRIFVDNRLVFHSKPDRVASDAIRRNMAE